MPSIVVAVIFGGRYMFWTFLITMVVADFVCTIAFSLLLVAIMSPLALLARQERAAVAVALVVVILAGVLQIYFWGLWAAFCSAIAVKYSALPGVSYHWVYYVIGFLSCTAPLSYLARQEVAVAENAAEANNTRRGTSVYSAIAIVAFVLFCIWPTLYSWPYSWALRYIV